LQNFLLISGFAVIENLMRPLLLGDFEAFRRSSSAKNLQTHGARDLERRDTHAATCAVHKYGLGSVRFRRVMQRMICSSIGNPNSCTLLEINLRRKRMHLLFERECVFRICAGEGPRGVYAIASLHFFDALANRFNHSGAIRSGSVGKRRLQGIGARAHVGVVGINAGRMNAHQHFAG
jgi:hypothetical protein